MCVCVYFWVANRRKTAILGGIATDVAAAAAAAAAAASKMRLVVIRGAQLQVVLLLRLNGLWYDKSDSQEAHLIVAV